MCGRTPMLTALRHLAALYAGLYLVNFHHMSMATLVNFFGDANGISKSMLGLITSGTYVGFFFGCYLLLPLLRRVSYIRTFAVSSASAAVCALLISLATDPFYWLALRVLSGAAIGVTQAIGEAWFAEVVEQKSKGMLYGVYNIVVFVGLGTSQLLLHYADAGMHLAMTVSAITAIIALFPICLTKFPEPSFNRDARMMSVRECFRVSRLSCIGIILVGACLSSGSLIVVYGRNVGLETDLIVILSSVMLVSSVFFHFPVGYVADKMGNRRAMLTGVCAAVVPAALLAGAFGAQSPFVLLLALVFIYFGLCPTIYPLCMALGTDLVSRENVTPFVSRAFQLYFIGGISGPFLTGALMDLLSDEWMFLTPAILMGALLALCASGQFMPKLRPLKAGPSYGTTALAGMAHGTPEHLHGRVVEREDLFVGPNVPEDAQPEEGAAPAAAGPELPPEQEGAIGDPAAYGPELPPELDPSEEAISYGPELPPERKPDAD